MLVTKLLSTVLVSVHSLALGASNVIVLVSVHSLIENVGTVFVNVWHVTVVVVKSYGTLFVSIYGEVVVEVTVM